MLRALSVFCLCSVFLNYCSFQVITSQRAERHEGIKSLLYATGGQAFSRLPSS